MDKLESTVLRREEAITNVTEDLVKANQIIAKLHADNKSAATKVVALSLLILTNKGFAQNLGALHFSGFLLFSALKSANKKQMVTTLLVY